MRVTKIQQQVKRKDRYSIYVNEKYLFSLSDYQLVGSGIAVGKEFSEAELQQFMQDSQFGRAYERALNYVMIRPRSRKEIQDYLVRTFLYPKPKVYLNKAGERVIKQQTVDKAAVEMMIEKIMSRLEDKGYINDESFARLWVQSRQLTKRSSVRKLQQELMTKGVDQSIIAIILQNKDETEIDNLKELIAKKRRLTRYQDEHKLIAYLLRQGFRYDDIRSQL